MAADKRASDRSVKSTDLPLFRRRLGSTSPLVLCSLVSTILSIPAPPFRPHPFAGLTAGSKPHRARLASLRHPLLLVWRHKTVPSQALRPPFWLGFFTEGPVFDAATVRSDHPRTPAASFHCPPPNPPASSTRLPTSLARNTTHTTPQPTTK